MTERKQYDVIIIGSGSIGLPAAMEMGREKLKVLVLDQFASAGQGSNKAAIGGIRATHSDPAKINLCLRSLKIISTWEETYQQPIEWSKGGYSFVAYSEQEEKTLKSLLVEQKKNHLNIDWHDHDDLLHIVPGLNREGLIGGTFSPDDGCCSTLLTSHAFFTQAKRSGVEFHFNELVDAIITEGDQIKGVKTNRDEYATSIVLNASGGWAKQVGSLLGFDHPVNPDSHEAGITEPVAQFLGPMLVDTRPQPGSANIYFYQHHTGQIIFCLTPAPSILGFDTRETSSFLPMIAKRVIEIMPCLKNVRVRRTWRGLYPMTPDGSPLIGWAREVKGYLMAIGMCGQGFMLGSAVGELLARLVTRSENELSQEDQMVLDHLSPYREFKGVEKLK
jgi:sarcosine oxidase, subunit beta